MLIIESNEKKRAHWKTEIVHQHLPVSDAITRTVKLGGGKSYLQGRANQHLHPLEIRCNHKCQNKQMGINST